MVGRILLVVLAGGIAHGSVAGGGPIQIGGRRQLFVDEHLIERLKNIRWGASEPETRQGVTQTP